MGMGEVVDSKMFGLLSHLDVYESEILFEQRESGHQRTPFEMEQQLYDFVAQGKPDEMVSYYMGLLAAQPGLKISVGKLSRNQLRQLKYMAVSAIAIICRVAIYNGVAEALAYSTSDNAIQELDQMDNPDDILLLEIRTIYGYAEMVAQSKANTTYTKAIRDSIEYINANYRGRITLEDLARTTPYSKEYLAKLFKKEVGKTVSDYILALRIAEAKKLLLEGKSSPDIACLLQFNSQSFFIKQFKKASGMTPKEFKDLHYPGPAQPDAIR